MCLSGFLLCWLFILFYALNLPESPMKHTINNCSACYPKMWNLFETKSVKFIVHRKIKKNASLKVFLIALAMTQIPKLDQWIPIFLPFLFTGGKF